jgi:hypothetical protein
VVDPANPNALQLADDDRPLSVNNVTVNEGSPFAVFTVGGREGQYVKLDLAPGTATAGSDYIDALEYWNGGAWTAYTPGTFVKVPGNTPTADGQLLVRVAIKQDTDFEVSEHFGLTVINAGGKFDTGTGTILDNGSLPGAIFTGAVASNGTPVLDTTTPKDDDRPFNPAYINDLRINEGSPWAVFTINGVPTAQISLSLPAGTAAGDATRGVDYADGTGAGQLQVYIQTASNVWEWVDYNPSATYPSQYGTPTSGATGNAVLSSDGELLVRIKLENQVEFEGDEPFGLSLQYTGNWSQAVNLTQASQPDTRNVFTSVLTADEASLQLDRAPNSIDTLSPNNRFVREVNKLPIAPGVTYHSIMGDRGKGDTPESSDGVVPYWSSHLQGAKSNRIVPSGHGAHEHPEGIDEVRRILKARL